MIRSTVTENVKGIARPHLRGTAAMREGADDQGTRAPTAEATSPWNTMLQLADFALPSCPTPEEAFSQEKEARARSRQKCGARRGQRGASPREARARRGQPTPRPRAGAPTGPAEKNGGFNSPSQLDDTKGIGHTPAPRAAAGDKDADAHTKHAALTAAASTERSAHLGGAPQGGAPHLGGAPHQGGAPASRGKGAEGLSQLDTDQPNTEPAEAPPADPAAAAAGVLDADPHIDIIMEPAAGRSPVGGSPRGSASTGVAAAQDRVIGVVKGPTSSAKAAKQPQARGLDPNINLGPQEAEGAINARSSIKSSKPSSSQALQAKLCTRKLQAKLCIREDSSPSRSRDFSREESLKGIFSSDRQQGHQAPFPSRHGRKGSGRQRPTQVVHGHQAAFSPFRHHARDKDANCPHNEVIKSPPLNVNVKEEFAYDLPKTASESDGRQDS
jgi:hypothetical protein